MWEVVHKGKVCSHPHGLTQETDDEGRPTGDYVCEACGETGFGKEWPNTRPS
jgi:hypothetical protein